MAKKTKAWETEENNSIVAESPFKEPMESIEIVEGTIPVGIDSEEKDESQVDEFADEEKGPRFKGFGGYPSPTNNDIDLPVGTIIKENKAYVPTMKVDLEKTVDGGLQTDDQGEELPDIVTGFAERPAQEKTDYSLENVEKSFKETGLPPDLAKEQKHFDSVVPGAVKIKQELPPISLPVHPHNNSGVDRKVIDLNKKEEEKKEHPGKALIKRLMRNGTVGGFKRRDKV